MYFLPYSMSVSVESPRFSPLAFILETSKKTVTGKAVSLAKLLTVQTSFSLSALMRIQESVGISLLQPEFTWVNHLCTKQCHNQGGQKDLMNKHMQGKHKYVHVCFFLKQSFSHIVSLSASMLHLGPCCVRRRDFLTVELKEDREDYRQLLWTEDIITHAQSTRPHVHRFFKRFFNLPSQKTPTAFKECLFK